MRSHNLRPEKPACAQAEPLMKRRGTYTRQASATTTPVPNHSRPSDRPLWEGPPQDPLPPSQATALVPKPGGCGYPREHLQTPGGQPRGRCDPYPEPSWFGEVLYRRMKHAEAVPSRVRQRALRLLAEAREQEQYETEWAAICAVASRLGVNSETLRKWLRRSEVDAGTRPGVTTEELAEIRRLKRENPELRRTNEIPRTASAFFAAELDRPAP